MSALSCAYVKTTGNKLEYKRWERILYFFPVQLLFVHLEKNLILLLFFG